MRPFLTATATLMLGTAACADVPSVITDTPVVQSLVAAVMGDLGTPAVIVTTGSDPHDFQLRPSQARALATADAIFWIGPEMTPWLAAAVGTSGASAAVALLDTPGLQLRSYDEAAHAADSTEQDHDHEHEGRDPHAWLDPGNARLWVLAIAETLAAQDPTNAATYRANAGRAAQDIDAMDRDLVAKAKGVTGGIVTSHDAYGYFAAHFGLNIVAALAEGDAARPGAARMTGIRQLLESGKVACIFPEAGHDPKAIGILLEGTGVKIGAPLDPEGIAVAPGPGLYRTLMTGLVDSIAECAG
jgi:zinc transport system substrate-binding protein